MQSAHKMTTTREDNQKNLNSNLSNLISDQNLNTIPYADDDPADSLSDHENDRLLNGDGGGQTPNGSITASLDSDHGIMFGKKGPSLSDRKNVQNLKLTIPDKDGGTPQQPHEVSVEIMSSPEIYENGEHPGPLVDIPQGQRPLRRNSISLPAGLDAMEVLALQKLQQMEANAQNNDSVSIYTQHEDGESMICSIGDRESLHPDMEEERPHRPTLKVPKSFRSKRRLSVAPLPSLRLNDKEMLANEFDSQSVISNQNSITSVSSLASLLKEKMQFLPSMMKKKKKTSTDFKIKAFVAILFMIIVFLVGYAYIAYHQQILARSYFDRVKFNKDERTIRIFDERGQIMITGKLGTTIPSGVPFTCLSGVSKQDGSVCLEWTDKARVYLHFEDIADTIRCYTVKWESLNDYILPTDCFDVSEDMGYWYGGGMTKNNEWPLEKASFDFAPFITGDTNIHQWGNVLKRYFINSNAVAITIDDRVPLYISMNHNNSGQFCLRAKNDEFAFVNRLTARPELEYKICIGDNMLGLHQKMTQQSLWDGIKEQDVNIVRSLLDEPVWQIPALNHNGLTEAAIYNYTEKVIELSFLKLGHVLVNEFWQEHIGDFSMDTERFATLQSTVNMLHRRGFRISLSIQPFISTESKNFGEAVANKLLIYERLSERSIPALTRYKSTKSAGVLDVTNNASIPWLIKKVEQVAKEYEIDSFFLDIGTAHNMPHYYQCSKSLDNPDQYKKIFFAQVEENLNMIGISSGVTVPKPPAFISLPPVNSSWEGLQTIITTVLSYGVIGYPFILPGPVGGDFLLAGNKTKMATFYALEAPPLPDQELYIRWFQLSTFLPVLRFTHLPSEYDTELVNEVSKDLAMIRQKMVSPVLKNSLSDAMNEALPLIRPLWMLDPTDQACLTISDEFSVGEDIIVAPILRQGETQREVYLPLGVWKDGIDGSLRKGSRWIHNYRVPENKVAYFMKMPNDTRF